jgi:hypothetical protein
MTILDKLAISQNRRDEAPNRHLARELVQNRDTTGITEIAANLQNKNEGFVKNAIHEKSHEYTKYPFSIARSMKDGEPRCQIRSIRSKNPLTAYSVPSVFIREPISLRILLAR